MKRILPFIFLILVFLPRSVATGNDGSTPGVEPPIETESHQAISVTLDGVSLTLSTPFLPTTTAFIPEPDDPIQVVNIVNLKPTFQSLTLSALPFDGRPEAEGLPILRPGQVEVYRTILAENRRNQGGNPRPGPNAELFGQIVPSSTSIVEIYVDVFEPKPVEITEWLVEAGERLWILRISQEVVIQELDSADAAATGEENFLIGINLTSENVDAPSTSENSNTAPFSGDLEELDSAASPQSDLPYPAWWTGECDLNHYRTYAGRSSYPLGGTYRGLIACGPRPWGDQAPDVVVRFFPGAWGELEWECVELVMRFMYLAYGIAPYQGNGNRVVDNYSGDRLIKINNGTPGIAPQPNDVMSSGPDTAVGHTSIVTASNVDKNGNGTITILEQNSSTTGVRTRTVSNWVVQANYTVIGWLHDPEQDDQIPPDGGMFEPVGNQTIQADTIQLEGWAFDNDSGIASAQFIAQYDGSWHEVGPSQTDIVYNHNWNWCEDGPVGGVPDGPISLAVRITDNSGNQNLEYLGLRHVIKHYTCPTPPKCSPGADQIAVFTDPSYQGACQILGIGSYANDTLFGLVGEKNTESILVGANVMATVFSRSDYQGRRETIKMDDANLSENRVGTNTISSIKVSTRSASPAIPALTWPPFGATVTTADSLTLVWEDTGGANEFTASLDGPSVATQIGEAPSWSIGNLPDGVYSWRVQSKNDNGVSAWSDYSFFIVNNDSAAPATGVTAPFFDNIEINTNQWQTSGLWHLTETDARSSSHSWWYGQAGVSTYDTNGVNSGGLTSPPIQIPVNAAPYFLSFWYKFETENGNNNWDQRKIQVSIDGSSFFDVYQLKNDPTDTWLQAAVDLSPYYSPDAAHTLQIRFYFHTVDAINNVHAGWWIDDVRVDTASESACTDPNETNDVADQATAIAYGQTMTGIICPDGDADYFEFSGSAGDQIVVDVDATSVGSSLDSILYLLDEDGTSILAQHDDEVLGVRQDPHLGFRLPRTGNYYLKIQSWDSPMGSGAYILKISKDSMNPSISNLVLSSASDFIATVSAKDSQSGVSHVVFHQFREDGWVVIGEDWDGADGWSVVFEATGISDESELIIYAQAYDWAGNWNGLGTWDTLIQTYYFPLIFR